MSIKFKDYQDYAFTWKHRGLRVTQEDPNDASKVSTERITMEDALSTPDARNYFPQLVNDMVRQAVEPLTIVTSLMTRIQYQYGQVITLPSVGATGTADMIPEGGEYPEFSLHTGPGIKIANVGKYGVAFKFTEEMRRYSQWDIFGLHVRAAANDMVRLKEVNAVNMLLAEGVTAFDNAAPASSIKGNTTGRRANGSGNGSVTMDNIFDAYGIGLENGFRFDTILVHPLTWILWVKDPIMRAFALQNGSGSFFAGWTGQVEGTDPFSNGSIGSLGPAARVPRKAAADPQFLDPLSQSGPMIPSYLDVPFRIVVSPFVPYNPATKLTNIIMFASGMAGAYIVDEELTMQEVPDNLRDMTKVKFRERYVFAPLNEGLGIATLKNVKVVDNELAISPLVTPTSSVTPETIDNSVNVLD